MKCRARIVVIVAVLALGFAGLLLIFVSRHAIPIDRFDRVVEGMTKVQVQDLIGVPHHIRHDKPDTTAFYYGGFMSGQWCNMEVFFGSDEQVTGKFHDH